MIVTIVAREMHPPIPGRKDAFHELSTCEIHPSLFHFDKFNGIRIIRKTKILN